MNRIVSRRLRAALLSLALGSAPIHLAAAQDIAPAVATAATPVVTPAVPSAPELAPGEFVWQPEAAAEGAVEIVVSIPQQLAYVYRGGTLIGVTTVSTGRPGHATPTGRFTILQKHREHYSNLYNNAPMPFMQRLTWGGVALHAGHIPGHPASHGCVRLPLAFARDLFGVTQLGAEVHIIDAEPTAETALAYARGSLPATMASAAVMLASGTR